MDNFKQFAVDEEVELDLDKITGELFQIVEFVLLKEPHLIVKLETVYRKLNEQNVSTIKDLKNGDEQTLLDYYENLPQFDNVAIEEHKNKFIKGLKQVSSMMTLFSQTENKVVVPTNLELLSKLEEKDKRITEMEQNYASRLEEIELRMKTKKCTCDIL